LVTFIEAERTRVALLELRRSLFAFRGPRYHPHRNHAEDLSRFHFSSHAPSSRLGYRDRFVDGSGLGRGV
jgi:hypothetical protein